MGPSSGSLLIWLRKSVFPVKRNFWDFESGFWNSWSLRVETLRESGALVLRQ